MSKKLVSLFCFVLSLMGGFSLEAASAPRKGQSNALNSVDVHLTFKKLSVPQIKSKIKLFDVHAQYQGPTGPKSILMILAAMPEDALPMNKRCQILSLLLDAGASWEEDTDVPMVAASCGYTEFVRILFDHPTNPLPIDFVSFNGPAPTTMLLEAIEDGRLEMVEFLVQRGADIHSKVGSRTPWIWACFHDQKKIMKFLEGRGAKTYKFTGPPGLSRTFTVDQAVHRSLKDLAAQNFDQDDGGPQAAPQIAREATYWSKEQVAALETMMQAADGGDMAGLKAVLDADPSLIDVMVPNHEDGSRFNVLGVAITHGDCAMIRYLLSKGARWDKELYFGIGGMGYMPIIALAAPDPEVLDCFLKAGMSVDHVFGDETLLHRAANLGRIDKVEFLLNKGARSQKIEAAFVAAERGHLDVVKLFCNRDPFIIKRTLLQEGCANTMLLSAIRGDQEDVVVYLLGEGADFTSGAAGVCNEQVEAQLSGNSRIIRFVEMHMKRRGFFQAKEQKERPVSMPDGVDVTLQRLEAAKQQAQVCLQKAENKLAQEQQKKKKKKKKKKKAVQEDDGGPELGQDSQLGMNAAERDLALLEEESDGAGWERCAQWLEQEEQERLAQKRQEQELEQLAQKEKIKKDKSAGLVAALQAFSESNTPATRLKVRNLLENGYDLYGQDAKEYALEYDNAYSVLYPETAKQRRVKAVPTSASSAKQLKSKNTNSGAHKNNGQNHGAGRKANKQEKKSHIAPQWAPTERLPKAAPSVYDRLQYAAGYVEDTGEPKQQTGDYALEEDVNGIADGGEAQDDSYAQDSNYIQDGGAGDVYHLAANYDQGGAYKKIGYGKDTLWVNMRHILDGDEHGGGHFDNEDKSCFPSWVKKDFEGRVERAIHNLDYRGTDIRGRDCVVGSFAPEQAGEVQVPFKGRMVTIYGYVVSDPETGEETLIEDRNGQPIAVLGTLYWISPSKYARLVGHTQGIEEKDDLGTGQQDQDDQELDLDSWEADVQAASSEPYDSIWGN